jgi:hypothetical protein
LAPLLALTLFVTGCASSQQGGKDLSAAGVKAANGLAEYYDQLADYSLDITELTAVNTGLTDLLKPRPAGQGQPAGEKIINETNAGYERIAQAFRRRAAMARNLATLYASIGNLAAYDARGAVGGAAKGLSDAVTSLPPVKGKIDADPGSLVSMIAGDVASLKQTSDLKHASELTGDLLNHVADFVQSERGGGGGTDLYNEVISLRASLAGDLAGNLIAKHYVNATAVMRAMGDEYQIPWDGQIPDTDESTRAASGAVAAAQARRQAALTTTAGNDILQALRALAAQHKAFAQTGQFNPADAQALAQRAQAYIDEIEKLKKEARDTRAARREEERQKKSAATKPAGPG